MVSAFRDRLLEEAGSLGRNITEQEMAAFEAHFRLLQEWSLRMNLTGLKDEAAIVRRHFLEPVAVADLLEDGGRLIDLGSGNGFPAIPLKVLRPGLDLVLVESSEKKSAFLWAVLRRIAAQDARVETRRVRHVGDLADLLPCRYLTLRAVRARDVLKGNGGPILSPGGKALFFVAADEAESLRQRPIAERPTLLVDMDPQASSTKGLGLKPNPGGEMYGVMAGEVRIDQVLVPTELEFLTVAPASRDLVGIEVELIGKPGREFRLKEAVEIVRDRFQYILVDCPPSLGLLTINALAAADGILIPVQCEYLALEGASELVETLYRIRASVNEALELDGVLLTMYDERTNLSRQVVADIRSFFKERVFRTIVPRNVRLGEAPSFGKPIMLYDIRSKGSESYLNLAREVIRRYEKTGTRQRTEQPHP